jgi:phosphoribosyl 1,2-cyclic phosphodiesterase
MKVTYWGVRGSYPTPGAATVRYGGHTSCVQVEVEGKAPVILDAGTGMRALGRHLRAGPLGKGAGSANVLITHLHWDHIQGLPFFDPVFVRGNRLNIYARSGRGTRLSDAIAGVAGDAVFPVVFRELPANFKFLPVTPGEPFEADGLKVTPIALNHPGTSTGYRIDHGGRSVSYITDTSPFDRIRYKRNYAKGAPKRLSPSDRRFLAKMRRTLVAAIHRTDLLIYDTTYTDEEYEKVPHWGHGTPRQALEIAREAHANTLVLFHHAPNRSDDEMDRMLADTIELAADTGVAIEAARQGDAVEVR